MNHQVVIAQRELYFSKPRADRLLVSTLANILMRRGLTVRMLTVDAKLSPSDTLPQVVCNLRRYRENIQRLTQFYGPSVQYINTPPATLLCVKRNMLERLRDAGIPSPVFVVSAKPDREDIAELPVWLHSTSYNLTIYSWNGFAENRAEVQQKWQLARSSGVSQIILTQHVSGPLVKAYCVGDAVLGSQDARIREVVLRVGRAFGLEVFGVDIIVDQMGRCVVLDVNDWPSFSAVRSAALKLIDELVWRKLKERNDDAT